MGFKFPFFGGCYYSFFGYFGGGGCNLVRGFGKIVTEEVVGVKVGAWLKKSCFGSFSTAPAPCV